MTERELAAAAATLFGFAQVLKQINEDSAMSHDACARLASALTPIANDLLTLIPDRELRFEEADTRPEETGDDKPEQAPTIIAEVTVSPYRTYCNEDVGITNTGTEPITVTISRPVVDKPDLDPRELSCPACGDPVRVDAHYFCCTNIEGCDCSWKKP